MNEIFNFHGQEVRTLIIDDEPWFVGKDVADILGYSKARNAIALHVDEDDALKQGLTLILVAMICYRKSLQKPHWPTG